MDRRPYPVSRSLAVSVAVYPQEFCLIDSVSSRVIAMPAPPVHIKAVAWRVGISDDELRNETWAHRQDRLSDRLADMSRLIVDSRADIIMFQDRPHSPSAEWPGPGVALGVQPGGSGRLPLPYQPVPPQCRAGLIPHLRCRRPTSTR